MRVQSPRGDGEIVLELRRLNDDSCTTNVVRNTAPATPPQAQRDPVPPPFGSCSNNGRLWYACEHPQRTCRALRWTGSRLPAADPRGPVSDSLRSLIDGARTVAASRVATRGQRAPRQRDHV